MADSSEERRVESPQPKPWNRSFEKIFTVLFVVFGLYIAFSFMPILMLIGAVLVPVAAIVGVGYILWKTFSKW